MCHAVPFLRINPVFILARVKPYQDKGALRKALRRSRATRAGPDLTGEVLLPGAGGPGDFGGPGVASSSVTPAR